MLFYTATFSDREHNFPLQRLIIAGFAVDDVVVGNPEYREVLNEGDVGFVGNLLFEWLFELTRN